MKVWEDVKARGKVEGVNDETGSGRHGPNSLQHKRKEHIEHVLKLAGQDEEQTAEILDIGVKELRYWIRKLEILEGEGSPK